MITSDREQELTNDVSFTTYDGFLHKLFLLNNWLIRVSQALYTLESESWCEIVVISPIVLIVA